jgi:hypothetical protein
MKRFIFSALAFALASSGAIAASGAVTNSPTGQKQAMGLPHPYSAAFTRASQSVGVDPIDGQLAEQLPRLKERAQQGDATAAAQIYTSLAQCEGLAENYPKSADLAAHCGGITSDDTAQVGKWLGVAAELGNSAARYGYAVGGFDYVLGVQQAGENPAALDAYVEKSKGYLDGLAKQCNFDAISALAKEQGRDGLLYKKNVDQAYKFLVIKQTIARAPSSADASYQAQLEGEISPASKIAALRQDASSFVDQYCR